MQRNSSLLKQCLRVSFLTFVCVFVVQAQALAPDAKRKLAKVNFAGLQKQQPQAMIELAGLNIGQVIDVAAIRAAVQRLSESGLFKKITVNYQYTAETIDLTFSAEEAAQQKADCVFDNFIWFTDQELSTAVKRDLPEFDGRSASDDFTIELIKKALTRLLQERKVPGTVSYERSEDTVSGNTSHMFSVKAPNLQVCTVVVEGLKANLKKELADAYQPHLNTAYSRMESDLFMRSALLPVYQDHGYLKAKFAPVQARPATSTECKSGGVTVSLPVEEGLQFRWDGIDWSGNQAFTIKELERDFKLKSGDIANLDWIEDSFGLAQMIFGTRGYITASITPKPNFDDAKQRVRYQAVVVEGPQYRAGQLILSGVSENEAKKLQGRWKLKPGDVFNTSLVGEFTQPLRQDPSIKNVDVKLKPNKTDLTADVEVVIQK
jgi:outer membrane protein assembly factor BamA